MSQEAREAFLEHYGVKGMRWGVRRGGDSASGGTPRKSAPSKKASSTTPRRSKAEMERPAAVRAHRIKVGKEVFKAVAISVGTIAIAAVAGPVIAAGAGAIARTLPGEAFNPLPYYDKNGNPTSTPTTPSPPAVTSLNRDYSRG